MKKIYLFIPSMMLSLGLLAQTPAPAVQKADSLETDTVSLEASLDSVEIMEVVEEVEDTLKSEGIVPQGIGNPESASKADKAPNPTTVTFTASGTWTVPPGVYEITVEAWGGGGGGGGVTNQDRAGGGGEGGSFVRGNISVNPGEIYTVVVGSGGNGNTGTGNPGGPSSFSLGATTFFNAIGGAGGAVGLNFGAGGNLPNTGNIVSGSITSNYYGGNGGNATNASYASSGGGGGSAGAGGNGGHGGSPLTAGAPGAGGTPSSPGAAGGVGRGSQNDGNGNAGNFPGGGGSGARNANNNNDYRGGHGANGLVRITYTISEIFTSPGSFTFTVPDGVDLISVEAWGGGGGGGRSTSGLVGAGGGGGGAYSRKIMPVVPGVEYTAIVGAGGPGGNGNAAQKTGGTSELLGPNPASTVWVRAVGGVGVANDGTNGAQGGSASNGIGDERNSGGNGADGGNFWLLGSYSGGGGGAAGPGGVGGNADDYDGGTGRFPGGNGAGGVGGFLFWGFGPGISGEAYGGGGSGGAKGWGSDVNGGSGAPGAVIIKWEIVKCDVEVNELFSESTVTPSIDPVTGIYYFDLCQDDLLELKAKAICDFCNTANYRWIFPDTGFEANGESYLINNVSSAMEGTLVVEGNNGQCYDSKRFRIRPSPGPSIDLGRELALCAGVPAEISIGNPDTDPASEDDHITVEAFSASDPFYYSVPFDSSTIEWDGSSISGFPGFVTVNPDPGAALNHTIGVLTVTDAFGCTSTFNYVKDVDGIPNDVRTAMSTGDYLNSEDYLWSGYGSTQWGTAVQGENWLVETSSGSGFAFASSAPTSSDNVFIAPYCRVTEMPSVSSGTTISTRDLTILTNSLGAGSLTLDGTLNIYGDFTNEGIFSAGTGSTVIFRGGSEQVVSTGGTEQDQDFGNVTLAQSNGSAVVSLVDYDMGINGTLTLNTGIVETGAQRVVVFNTSPAAVTDGNEDSYIFGNLRRYFATNSNSYAFPVGSGSFYRLAELENENLTGISFFDARFDDSYDPGSLNAQDFGTAYTSIDPAGIWELTPDHAPTGGTYDIKLWFDEGGFSLVDNQFGVIKRQNSSDPWVGEGLPENGVLNPADGEGRLVSGKFASRYDLGSFSQFGIGKSDDPLPIELLSFTATYRAPEVVLEWATGSEINNDYFTLERSPDVEQAEIIGYVDGAGNSSQTLWYRFVDHNPLPGISYYRLKQTDFDGKFEYFDWVAVDAGAGEGDGLKVLVETHPQGHNLRIFSPGGGRLQVEVTDLLGRSVVNEQLSPAGQGQVEVFIPASASRQSVLIYRVTDGLEVVAGKIVR